MDSQLKLHCSNCGADFTPATLSETLVTTEGYACPVCQFYIPTVTLTDQPQVSISDLEAQLDALLSVARTSGVTPDEITRVLRDELEFHAELGHMGRRLVVQIIDLGPQTMDGASALAPDRRHLLHSRGLTN